MRLLPPSKPRIAPHARLALAGAVAAAGAYLVALWAVGVVLVVEAVFYVLVVWDDGKPASSPVSPAEFLERRAR
jgi:hypothetical protein